MRKQLLPNAAIRPVVVTGSWWTCRQTTSGRGGGSGRERILGPEIARAGVKTLGPLAKQLIGLTQPSIHWVSLARGMGVTAARVETAEDLAQQLRALGEPGPQLVEALLSRARRHAGCELSIRNGLEVPTRR